MLTRTSETAFSPRDGTIAPRSINKEGGSAALVLTRKQEAIARPFPSVRKQFPSSNSNVWFISVVSLNCLVVFLFPSNCSSMTKDLNFKLVLIFSHQIHYLAHSLRV